MQSAGPAWILRALAAPVLVAVALLLASQIPGAAASPPERTPPRFGDEMKLLVPVIVPGALAFGICASSAAATGLMRFVGI